MTDIQLKIFKNAISVLGEGFEDYLIIAKPAKHNIFVHSSDQTWGCGAAKRYSQFLEQQQGTPYEEED